MEGDTMAKAYPSWSNKQLPASTLEKPLIFEQIGGKWKLVSSP
jgi:hypothetical protein